MSWKLHSRYCHIICPIDYLILASSEEASFSPGSPRQRKLARNENNFETQLGKTRKESVKFKETEQQAMIQNKLLTVRFGKTLLLGLVMNFPWLLSFVKVFSKNTSDYIWYPFVIFHGFQVFFSTYLHTLLCTVMCKRNHQTYILKGQLISKGNFCVFNSPKNQLENVNFCPSQLGQKFFVRFLGELKKPKSPFEIN